MISVSSGFLSHRLQFSTLPRLTALFFLTCFSTSLLLSAPSAQAEVALHPDLICEEPLGEIKSVMLFLHGLNNSPQSLKHLRSLVRQQKTVSCQLRLKGHTEGEQILEGLEKSWREQTLHAVAYLQKQYPKKSLFALGYSLGGALLLDSLSKFPPETFDGVILLAPAVTLSWKASFLKILTPLRALDLSLPSFAPADYRVQDSTSLLLYHATLRISDDVRSRRLPLWLKHTPVLLAVSAEDELLDPAALKRFFLDQELEDLRIVNLQPDPLREDAYAHLIVDQEMLGAQEWGKLSEAIVEVVGSRKDSN